MWHDVINTAIGVVFGLATGFYFERRTTKATRLQNGELERELDALRSSIYSVGGTEPLLTELRGTADGAADDRFVAAVRDRARQTQGADGRTSRHQLTSHFCALGHRRSDVEIVIALLCDRGHLLVDGKWLEVR